MIGRIELVLHLVIAAASITKMTYLPCPVLQLVLDFVYRYAIESQS